MTQRALLYRRPTEPHTLKVHVDGTAYAVRLRRHRLARRYTLRIHPVTREALLTMPPRGTIADARDFAERQGAWIAARLGGMPALAPFAPGTIVPLRNRPHRIVHRPGVRGTVWIEIGDDGEKLLCAAGEAEHLARRVRDFLKREARRDLEAAVARHAAALGVRPKRLTMRDQTSRWGSCSTTGVLSFSWRLILAPSHVLDYLAAHEVAHLVEMNHSRRFWALVTRLCGSIDRAKAWLDAHSTELHRYGLSKKRRGEDRAV